MNLIQMEALREIVLQGTVTKAASVLRYTQPTLTHQIKMLERELGAAIFQRSGRRLALTPAGEAVHEAALEILQRLDALRDHLAHDDAHVAGHIRVGCGQMIATHVLPRLLDGFLQTCPRVRFSIVENEAGALLNLLMDGHIDMVFGLQPRPQKRLQFHPLESDCLRVALASKHPLARKREIRAEDLSQAPLVRFRSDTMIQKRIDALLPTGSRKPIHAFEMDSAQSVLALVQRNLGVAILPGYALRIIKPRGIAARPFAPEVALALGLAIVLQPRLSKAMALFRAYVAEHWLDHAE